ncbi:shikimate kinase [Maribacter halichondriae]|uniref:shikimate kinase n=1 Tax=Maribacter halichondriae TaxID=2980554 RepID=UPI002358FDCE|nr:shikimate kinase [Maribacter sp. Hal144]
MKSYNHIVVLVGVCGTGKSAVGQKVAQKLEIPFYDVDKFFASEDLPKGKLPQDVNLEKWLTSVEDLILDQSTQKGCVISCSILKKEHRTRLTARIDHLLDWVFMNDSYENAALRVEKIGVIDRRASLLKSDFETLEVPKRALTIDMSHSEQEIVDTILKYLARKYG